MKKAGDVVGSRGKERGCPTEKKPLLAITLGDPCGIGPEITARALLALPPGTAGNLVVIGPRTALLRAFHALGKEVPLWTGSPTQPGFAFRLLDPGITGTFPAGAICRSGGLAAIRSIETAHELCASGTCAGMVTGPIGKKAIQLAGSPFAGHTDMLQALCGVGETRMAMVWRNLRVVMTTLHVAYRRVPELLTRRCFEETLRLTLGAFAGETCPRPRVAVGGLNPHAGEDGLFGDEEQQILIPVMAKWRRRGADLSGPFPTDSLFKPEMRKRFDVFIAQTHDQGLIAIKTLGGLRCVNVTLGLPYVRTSVGHGTAYDIAGRGEADSAGLLEAVKAAFRMVRSL